MVNARLMYVLEIKGLLANTQCGFRKSRSTVDHLVRYESFVRNAFIRNEHVVSIFFYLEKAYDTTWKFGILADLHEMGFRGLLPTFIGNFLSDRKFKVRIGNTLFDTHSQEMGVPQGSILSPVLFSIKINDIVKSVKKGMENSLFVDDFALSAKGSSLHSVERQLQLCINKLEDWIIKNGFKFSVVKTECLHLYKQRKVFPEPDLRLNGSSIKVVTEAKFLGVIFDQRFSFLPHLKYLKSSCQKALNVLRVVGHTDWGADRTTLLKLYRALVRSKLDYACMIYGSARASYLKTLDSIHHAGLRICLGAFRTSPVQSLYVEANEPSLKLRRLRLTMNYVLKIRSCPENPAYSCLFETPLMKLFEANPVSTAPLGIRILPFLEEAEIPLKYVNDDKLLTDLSPWTLPEVEIRLDLTRFRKAETNQLVYKGAYIELCSKYKGFERIFTDGSKSDCATASAAVVGSNLKNPFKRRLLDDSSVFTAELNAIRLALRQVYQSRKKKFLILSDSLSSLQAIASKQFRNYLVVDFYNEYAWLVSEGKIVVLAWVPGHVGIWGNTIVDAAAKSALDDEIETERLPFESLPWVDLRRKTSEYVQRQWQIAWNQESENKLFQICPDLKNTISICRQNRREETLLARLHIGHSYLTHGHLLTREPPPECEGCSELYSIKHILIDCADLIETRKKYYNVDSLKVLFREVDPENIFGFLKEINLFYKL